VLAVHGAARRAVDRARKGEGPTLIEAMTYRMKGHAEHDAQSYVPKEELEQWRQRDPLERYARELVASAAATAEELSAIDRAVSDEIDREVEAAEKSPLPSPEDALKNVYAAGIPEGEPAPVRRNS